MISVRCACRSAEPVGSDTYVHNICPLIKVNIYNAKKWLKTGIKGKKCFQLFFRPGDDLILRFFFSF